MENIKELKALLARPRDIVITGHRNPDGDAIGSSLGLYHFLNKDGHTVRIIMPSEYPENFSWMPDIEKVIIYDLDPEYSKEMVERADVTFCLDFNSLERIDKLGELVGPSKAKKVVIDHHLYPENFADYLLSDTTASSTCELIFDFIHMLGMAHELDARIGECLFTGIVTDTGSFRYGTSPKLYRTVANLIELGVDDYQLQDRINNSMQERQLRLLGHCLHNRMELFPEYCTGLITLTKQDYEDFDIQRGDTEGIVNYLLKIKEVKMAVFIMEQPKIVKLSLRSKGNFSVQEIARQHFKGGGHQNASGGFSFQPLSTTVNRFKSILPEYKDKLLAATF